MFDAVMRLATWLAVFVVVLLATPVATYADGNSWYSGGTLHRSTIEQWHRGSHADQLATSSDWVVAYIGQERAIAIFNNGLRELAEATVTCISEATRGLDEIETLKTTEIAVSCMILMDFPRKAA